MPGGRCCGSITHPGLSPSHPESIHHPQPVRSLFFHAMGPPAHPSPHHRLLEDHGQVVTPSGTNAHPCSLLYSIPRGSLGDSTQTTFSPGTPGNGGAFEGKVRFINQPIVDLPSAGSSSPGVSLGAVDTDVNCQGCPPPSTSLLGHPAGPAHGASVAMLPTGPL